MTRCVHAAALVLLTLFVGSTSQAQAQSEDESGVFPTYVWVDALGSEPAEYAYWTAGSRHWRWSRYDPLEFPESGIGFPSVLRKAAGPGHIRVTFNFYDENDNWIKSAHSCVEVDELGFPLPCYDHFSDGYWRGGPGYFHGFRSWSPGADQPEQSLYDYPWPEVELGVELSGDGPWTATCHVASNIPAHWFLSYEWDLDHDGRFGRTTGRKPLFTCELTLPGKYIFSVRATDMRGYSAEAQYEFSVPGEVSRGWEELRAPATAR
ncbi:MAG TPA: hypothetical protein ENO21_03495 [Firmicutes bacterium]|nr:hypothetical protein [Bacillota bacterium]